MSLPNILLSLVREPACGTELIALFRSSIRHFWKADLSQIYRALDGLEAAGEVKSTTQPSPRGPDRRVYSLTAKGRRRLLRWVEQTPRVPGAKFEYLAQLFSAPAAADPAGAARKLLEALQDDARLGVSVLEGIEAVLRDVPGYPDDLPTHVYYPWLTLRHGLARRRALVTWIDESLASLARRGAEKPASNEMFHELIEMLRSMGAGSNP